MARSINTWNPVACSTSAVQACAANGNRAGFALQNNSDVDIYVLIRKTSGTDTTEVTSSNGVKLASGQNWFLDGSECPDGEIRAIAASGSSKTLVVVEW